MKTKPQFIITGKLLCTAPRRNVKITAVSTDLPYNPQSGSGAIYAGAMISALIGANLQVLRANTKTQTNT